MAFALGYAVAVEEELDLDELYFQSVCGECRGQLRVLAHAAGKGSGAEHVAHAFANNLDRARGRTEWTRAGEYGWRDRCGDRFAGHCRSRRRHVLGVCGYGQYAVDPADGRMRSVGERHRTPVLAGDRSAGVPLVEVCAVGGDAQLAVVAVSEHRAPAIGNVVGVLRGRAVFAVHERPLSCRGTPAVRGQAKCERVPAGTSLG